jgi:hypothetical protein
VPARRCNTAWLGARPSSTLGHAFYLGGAARLARADVVHVHQTQGPRLAELPLAPACFLVIMTAQLEDELVFKGDGVSWA